MKWTWLAAVWLASQSSSLLAGGIDRSGQGLGALFEAGNHLEISLAGAAPSVEGIDLAGGATGNVGGDYRMASLSAKFDVDQRLSLAVVLDQTYGADLRYGETSPLLGGTRVDEDSDALLGLVRYRLGERFSIHGGLRVQRSSAEVRLNGLAYGPVSGYRVRLGPDTATGIVAGVAYERPEIALRLAATYHDAVDHALATTETGPFALLDGRSTTRISTPRAINLDFQTGIAADTLLFGQLRWADWSAFRVDPQRFMAVTGEGLIELDDTRTMTLGIAQRFNPRWSGALSVNYEAKGDPLVSPLSPVNGRRGATLAAIYTTDRWRVTAGISHVKLGDALLETGTPDTQRASMRGNRVLGLGLKVGWSF